MSRALSTAFTHLRRSPYQALSVILVLFNTFFLGYVYSFIFFGSEHLLQYFETRPQVIAFFNPGVEESKISEIRNVMQGKPYVESVKVVTQEDALASYKEEDGNNPLLAELLSANIFPASIEVRGKDIAALDMIVQDLESQDEHIEEIDFQEDIVDKLGMWTKVLRLVGIGMISILALTSVLIVSIIISMKVLAKKQEIVILRLLGATPFYIQGPFMAEGIFYGVLGSLLGWGAAVTMLLYITPWVLEFQQDIALLPVAPEFLLLQISVGTGISLLLGVIASSLALRRLK